MSEPTANDDAIVNQFNASRGATGQGGEAWLRQRVGGQGASAAKPAAAAPSSDMPVVDPDTPFGLHLENTIAGTMKAAGSVAKSAVSQYTGDVTAAYDQLKTDYLASIPDPEKYKNASFWDRAKMQFNEQVSAGKSIVDAFNLVMSPISSALDVATTGISQGAQAAAPSVFHAKALKEALDRSLIGLGPKGGLSKVAGAAKAGEAAAGATEGAAAGPPKDFPASAAPAPAASPPAFTVKGQEGAPAVKLTDALRQQTRDYIAGKIPDNPIQASLEHLADDETRNQAIADVARFIPKDTIKPDDVLRLNARVLGLTPDEVMTRLRPLYPSDEVMAAGAMLVNSGAEEFGRLAKIAVDTGTPEAWEQATKAFALQNKIVGDWREAGTEWGRAGRVRNQAWDARSDFTKELQKVLETVGADNVEAVIRRTAALDDPEKISPFIASLRWMKSRDGLLYGWYNVLLSNPRSIARQLISNAAVAVWEAPVRAIAARFGSGAVKPGEGMALLSGYTGAFGDALNAAGKAMLAGRSQFAPEYRTMDGLSTSRISDLVKGTAPIGDNSQRAAFDYIRAALPTSWNAGADDFAKVMFYRGEARSLLFREAMDKGLSGDALASHIEDGMNAMPEHIHNQALEGALRNSFQEAMSPSAQHFADLVDKVNWTIPGTRVEIPFGRLVVSFIKTPANITRFAYRNSPLPLIAPSEAYRADLAAGGARRDLALARVGLGTGLVVTLLPFVLQGTITGGGPKDPQLHQAWLRAGNKPYSVFNKVSYRSAIDPFGLQLGAIADSVETMKFAKDQDSDDIAASIVFGTGNALLSKSYLQGSSDFLDALRNPDTKGKLWSERLATSASVPSGVAAIAAAMDPWMRAHYDFLDSVQARTPYYSTSLPPQVDMWGKAIPQMDGYLPFLSGTGVARAISPVQISPPGDAEPIDKWIWDNRAAFPQFEEGRLGLSPPGRVQSFSAGNRVSVQVELTPQQHYRLKVLAGNELKDPVTKMGAMDTLNAMVEGRDPSAARRRQWAKGSDDAKALMVLDVWNDFRKYAKEKLLKEDDNIRDVVTTGVGIRREELTRGNGGAPAAPQFGGP